MEKLTKEAVDLITSAYHRVHERLRDAVESAKDNDEFISNLHSLQLEAQRTLAILIYNGCLDTTLKTDEMLNAITKAIGEEIKEIAESAKDQQKMGAYVAPFAPTEGESDERH